jgi:hypothetical protein
MGRLEMANHRSDTLTLALTLYEAGLALCAMYYLAISINQLIPESFISSLLSADLFFP